MHMKFVVASFLLFTFQMFVWADVTNKSKSPTGIVHIEHPDHVPHHPKEKEPTEKSGHDGVIYPRKRIKKWILESA